MTDFQILSAFNCKCFIKKYHQHYKLFKILLNKDCPVFICDFHREQAWESWFHKKVNSHSEDKSKIAPLLRGIAHSETLEKSEETTGLLRVLDQWWKPERLYLKVLAESKRGKQKHHLVQWLHPLMIKRILDKCSTKMFSAI